MHHHYLWFPCYAIVHLKLPLLYSQLSACSSASLPAALPGLLATIPLPLPTPTTSTF